MAPKKGRHPNSLKNLKPVKPGEIRNAEGGRSHDKHKKIWKRFTNEYLVEIIDLAIMGNLQGLKKVVDNPDSPAIQVGVAKALFTAISKGDWDTLERIISRIVGKVPDKIDLSGSVGSYAETQEDAENRQKRVEMLLQKRAMLNGR